jgi:mRNA interferase MazF
MTCKPGDLVGIPFPYSDLITRKRRPVLVLTNPDRNGDFIGLAVTSVLTEEFAIPIDQEKLATGRMPRPSWVRCDKIFTLSETIIAGTYGKLRIDVFQQIVQAMCSCVGCTKTGESAY